MCVCKNGKKGFSPLDFFIGDEIREKHISHLDISQSNKLDHIQVGENSCNASDG